MCIFKRVSCHCGRSGFTYNPCTRLLIRSFLPLLPFTKSTTTLSPWKTSDNEPWCKTLLYNALEEPSHHLCQVHQIESTLAEKESEIRSKEEYRRRLTTRKGEVKIEDVTREDKFEEKVRKKMRTHCWAAAGARAELEKERREEEKIGARRWVVRTTDMRCSKCGNDLAPIRGYTGRRIILVFAEMVAKEILRQYQVEGRRGVDKRTRRRIAVGCEWKKEELICPVVISSCVVVDDEESVGKSEAGGDSGERESGNLETSTSSSVTNGGNAEEII